MFLGSRCYCGYRYSSIAIRGELVWGCELVHCWRSGAVQHTHHEHVRSRWNITFQNPFHGYLRALAFAIYPYHVSIYLLDKHHSQTCHVFEDCVFSNFKLFHPNFHPWWHHPTHQDSQARPHWPNITKLTPTVIIWKTQCKSKRKVSKWTQIIACVKAVTKESGNIGIFCRGGHVFHIRTEPEA